MVSDLLKTITAGLARRTTAALPAVPGAVGIARTALGVAGTARTSAERAQQILASAFGVPTTVELERLERRVRNDRRRIEQLEEAIDRIAR